MASPHTPVAADIERRYEPYGRADRRPPQPAANYHWYTMCALRGNTIAAYDAVYALHTQLRDGTPISERQVSAILTRLADFITCGVCGEMIPRLDNSSFVAKCGHVFHKAPVNCWAQARNACCICKRAA